MMPIPYYQEWSIKADTSWYPNKNGILWSNDPVETPTFCPFCNELDIGYPGDVVYNSLPNAQKIEWTTKANLALQEKVFKFAKAISKMCLFENEPGEPDTLDLRADLTPLFPQIDPNNFIITGLNYYENSVHGALVNNVHKYYAGTSNGFNRTEDVVSINNAESNKSRQQSIHHREQARVGLYANQRSGKLYSWFVQGVCGSDANPMHYEYYNSNLESDAGFIKSWDDSDYTSNEISSFPVSSGNPNHRPGERKYTYKFALKNTNRRSALRHLPWINMTNDFLNRTQIVTTVKYKDEIIWSDNNIASVISTNMNKMVSAPYNFYNQLRPCAQGETPNPSNPQCRDIIAEPYIKPIPLTDNVKIRNNNYDTFNCSTDPTSSGFSPNCVNYCYADPVVPAGGSSQYNITSLLTARRHVYGLAVEYASYDDMIAIPYEDIANDVYWTGYFGQFANFDPFITTPPATISEAQQMGSSGWPHIRLSETAKRAQGLGLILAARKDYSINRYIKNPTQTNVRDWPQPAANFDVDRRPGITVTIPVSGGPATGKVMGWVGNNTTFVHYFKKCLDGSGNPIPNTGFQSLIENYLEWNYNNGLRRFMIWTPGGTIYHQYPNGSTPAVYTSAITSSLEQRIYDRYEVFEDGSVEVIERIVNPSEACWKNITTPYAPISGDTGTLLIPSTVEEAESYPLCSDSDWDGESPCFDPEGRKQEILTCLGEWISAHPDADVGIYMGYTIPTLNGEPDYGTPTIIGDAGSGGWLQNTTGEGIRGWQVPNPENNQEHADFLQSELQPWIDIGINFLGMDVGVGMFNYQYGGTLSFGSNKASRNPVGDYKEWLQTTFPTLKTIINEAIQPDWKAPVLDEFNKPVEGRGYPRKTILKTDTSKEVCKGIQVPSQSESGDPFNTVYTDTCWHNKGRERFRKLDPLGKDYRTPEDQDNFVYSSSAYQYSPYIVLLGGNLNSGEWNIGNHSNNNTIQGWAGLDPNNMWCWYRKNTEIGLMVENFYILSDTLRKAYRQQFPNNVDANGNNTYSNIWQMVPAWHDTGLATRTPAPTGIQSWDGRNHLRDTDYYNKVRNEIFNVVKNYIERGYVYWTGIGSLDFQLNKDVHQDLLNYVAGYETEDDIYPEDELGAPPTQDLNKKNFVQNPAVTYEVKESSIKQLSLDIYTTTDEG
jgi:hypothetical protein